jgi:hypothetical protein
VATNGSATHAHWSGAWLRRTAGWALGWSSDGGTAGAGVKSTLTTTRATTSPPVVPAPVPVLAPPVSRAAAAAVPLDEHIIGDGHAASPNETEVQAAQWTLAATVHPESGEIIPPPFRIAAWPFLGSVPCTGIAFFAKYAPTSVAGVGNVRCPVRVSSLAGHRIDSSPFRPDWSSRGWSTCTV